MDPSNNPRTTKVIILLSLLPLLLWPVALLHSTSTLFNDTGRLLMLLFPLYALPSVAIAWYCREERPEVMWVLLWLLWLSYGAVFVLATM